MDGAIAGLILVGVLILFAAIIVAKSIAIIPQAEAAVIERLGRYTKTVSGQLTLLVPFIDKIRARVDLRERVVSFPPQPVITQAEGQKQAQILSAEGAKQAAILAAEADRQSRMLRAQGERAASYLQAQGQAKAIEKTFAAIKAGRPTPEMLAYQYLQTLPLMAKGEANKVWLVPSDFGAALQGFAKMLGAPGEDGVFRFQPSPVDENLAKPEDDTDEGAELFNTKNDPDIAPSGAHAVAQARTPVQGIGDPPPQYAPLSQQAQPPGDYTQPVPRHGAPRQS